jgi:hypothetical protein
LFLLLCAVVVAGFWFDFSFGARPYFVSLTFCIVDPGTLYYITLLLYIYFSLSQKKKLGKLRAKNKTIIIVGRNNEGMIDYEFMMIKSVLIW